MLHLIRSELHYMIESGQIDYWRNTLAMCLSLVSLQFQKWSGMVYPRHHPYRTFILGRYTQRREQFWMAVRGERGY